MYALGEVSLPEAVVSGFRAPSSRASRAAGPQRRSRPSTRARSTCSDKLSRCISGTVLCVAASGACRLRRRYQDPRGAVRGSRRAEGSAGGSTPLSLGTATAQVLAPKEDSGSWVLPSVDKDISEFYTGRATSYAWVQTSETLYLFTPLPQPEVTGQAEKEPASVQLDLTSEGRLLRLVVEGTVILDGSLSHQIKPGEEVWMIEEAPDGREFVVVELDKLVPGINWASVLEPKVEVLGPYANPVVELPVLTREEESLVDETLRHLQRTKRVLQPVEGRAGAFGDVLTVDMQGYAMKEDGSRGEELDVGSATGLELELGASNFSAEVEQSLDGISVGETRDVQVTLGQRAGGMGGQQIICAVTCQEVKEQQLPELNDEFAREIKREEQFKQAGTMEGIPEEEEGSAENFSLADLRAEIGREVQQVAQTQSNDVVDTQLRSHLRQTLKVKCEWADLQTEEATDEELSVAIRFIAEKEGLMQNIDMDDVERKTWSKLGEPEEGETIKQVGKDPAREYQDAHREILRSRLTEEVLSWLRQKIEVVK